MTTITTTTNQKPRSEAYRLKVLQIAEFTHLGYESTLLAVDGLARHYGAPRMVVAERLLKHLQSWAEAHAMVGGFHDQLLQQHFEGVRA